MDNEILLTGATGLIGREILNQLLDKGYKVCAIEHLQKIEPRENLRIIKLDLLSNYEVSLFFKENFFQTFIHMAWYGDKKVHSHNVNLDWAEASLNLLKNFCQTGGKKFLGAGSISEYDFKYGYFSEDITPLENKSLYGQSKSALYKVAKTYCENNDVDFKWARIFNLYGKYERKERLIPYVINTMLNDEPVKVSTCEKYQDYLSAYDVAVAVIALLESDIQGAVNICSGKPVQLKYIVNEIAKLTEFKGEILWGAIPAAFGDEVVVGNNEKLKSIGWEPKYSLDEGLKSTIEWWKNYNKENN